MEKSILTSVKKFVGIASDDTSFDQDVLVAINTFLAYLTQMGVGYDGGLIVDDSSKEWSDFMDISDSLLQPAQSYVCLSTKLMFDPPQSSAVAQSYQKMIAQAEWRLNSATNYDRGDG